MAELSDEEKDAISHRGRATRALAAWLEERGGRRVSDAAALTQDELAGARARKRSAQFSVVAACFLVALKLGTGLATGSLAFLAEAAHSATDLVAALLTLFAVRVATRPPDQEHNYGHGKAEHLAALGESAVLMLFALAIGAESVRRLVDGDGHGVEATWWSFLVLAIVIGIDLARMLASRRTARRHGSPALAVQRHPLRLRPRGLGGRPDRARSSSPPASRAPTRSRRCSSRCSSSAWRSGSPGSPCRC